VTVRLVVAPSLRFLLPLRARTSGVVDTRYDGTATLGHLVQAAGVPLTEVGALVLDGEAVPASTRPTEEDVVEVLPPGRPQPLNGPPLLLLDVHLGALSRRLRLLGVDTAYDNHAEDDALVTRSLEENRLLLTQDRRLLMRRALQRAAFVRGALPDEQLADVLDRFDLPLAPLTHCASCGGALHDVPKAQVLDRLEPGTRRTQDTFRQCERCGQVYWRGAHAERLDGLVSRASAGFRQGRA
jgi:hypothetical protein